MTLYVSKCLHRRNTHYESWPPVCGLVLGHEGPHRSQRNAYPEPEILEEWANESPLND